ncbi:polyprenyl synthetase family protein [Lentisphaerota bacterium ZTH]|nr:polyprenyl synthetase family protein [Lentisphaerota bacterium]WET05299.1 polyprenyl synthetase family protein [Lentisphaerota bacterium ZTH]
MLNELKNIAEKINRIILNDDFPSIIEPSYLRGTVLDYPGRGGKRLRPALLCWCCAMLGGDIKKALYPAAAAEIYHNWTLVHDDIIDEDDVRRGLPSAHASLAKYARSNFKVISSGAGKFGRDFAMLAGDIQQGWAANTLLKAADHGLSPELTIALSRRMQELVTRELISGEALDVEFPMRGINNVTSRELLDMLYLKTGALLRFCAEAGTAIALESTDFDRPEIRKLGDFASTAGIAFQLRDDWLGVFGNFSKFGKTLGSDLAEGKPTLLLLKACEALEPYKRSRLLGLIGLKNYSMDVIEEARELFIESGAEEYVRRKSEHLADESKAILKEFPENQYRSWLLELTDYLVHRDK